MRLSTSLPVRARAGLLLAMLCLLLPWAEAAAQGTGTVRGTVTREDGTPLGGVIITVAGTIVRGVTNPRGVYVLDRVPVGPQTLVFRWLGYRPVEVTATVTAGATATADARMEQLPIQLSELSVTGASRAPERAVEAPAAFAVVEPRVLQTTGITGQAPLALREVPGVDIVQSGMNDFNVNARGFNSTLNRRVLVLQDGRDLAIAFLGSQEWNALAVPTDEYSKLELVRGPGSALYGANAFFGVLNITTPTAREVAGTKISLGGGELSTLRADIRHAGVFGRGRWGYRLNAGFNQSDSWSRSRTSADLLDLRREYCPDSVPGASESGCFTDRTVPLNREVRALNGQTIGAGGAAEGDADPVRNAYGSARFDYYADNGSVLTAETGIARVENEIFVTGIGRVQVTEALRPYARFNWANPGFNVMAYWNRRESREPQYSLASGRALEEQSDIFHIEGQDIESFASDRGRVIYGMSGRNYRVNTDTTLMRFEDDDRSDYYWSGFGQLEYRLSDQVRAVVAARFDIGTLIDPQFSPKAALVISPNERHSFRVTVNRAFQVPNYSEFFLRVPAGAPVNLTTLEGAIRAGLLGTEIADTVNAYVAPGTLFSNSAAVPVFARGNNKLDVETTLGLETGYRGDITDKVYVTVDLYFNRIRNFVTDLLPGVNPAFPYWTAPSSIPSSTAAATRTLLVNTVRGALAASSPTASRGLTRTEDGNTAIVVSYANAGRVSQYGVETGAGIQLSRTLRADGTITYFNYDVDEDQVQLGDSLLANTPKWKGTLSASYAERRFQGGASMRTSGGYSWAAGVFAGYVEPVTTFDLNASYDINNNFRLFATGTNVFDNRHFAIYGGSVIGRRILGGVTARF
ncbi:MAG TPA: TonB-dependent receptor [Gemmatimonadales bacterium]|nr:TonB-dependent receptor [Gemmatimonadales bacterium]